MPLDVLQILIPNGGRAYVTLVCIAALGAQFVKPCLWIWIIFQTAQRYVCRRFRARQNLLESSVGRRIWITSATPI